MITIRYEVHRDEGIFRPIVACDQCGWEITDAKEGVALWDDSGAVRHVHKNRCDTRKDPYWAPLEDHVRHLVYNVGLGKLRRAA